MRELRASTKSIGVRPADVYVTSPWGTAFDQYRDGIQHDIEKYATAQGFSWIQPPSLADKFTSDGTHPTQAGVRKLADLILASSTLPQRFGVAVPTSEPVEVRCAGTSACRSAQAFVGPSAANAGRHRYWGQAVSSSTNYAAYRLTHGGRRTPRLPGTSALEWRVGALETGVKVTGVPKVGSLAWWPHDPQPSR
ncbi:hypothetical protein [Aeromicrobium sp. UC242_57]|uniref:hypothetical protein n=1 Tax=Aeromicrobium sp. UC242_57 TaxID=3374624 RepID=UPI0037A22759